MKKLIFLILIFLNNLNSQDYVKIYKPKEIKFGREFSLKFELENPPTNIRISTSNLDNSDFGFLSIKKEQKGFEIFLIPFNVGISTFPSIDMETDGKIIKSYPITLEIKPLNNPDENAEIKDIAKIFSFLLWLKILIAILMLLILFLIYRYIIKKRKNYQAKGTSDYVDTRTPYQRAIDSLNEVYSSNLIKDGLLKEYYSKLSDILRQYLEEEYKINAIKLVTPDIIKELKSKTDINSVIKTREFLDISDIVKFAKYIPENERALKDAEFLKEIIDILEKNSQDKKRKEQESMLKKEEENK